MSPWLWLMVGICLEASGTICLKLSNGLERLVPTVLLFIFYGLSFVCVAIAAKRIELGIAYAVWSGVGTVFITAAGIAWFSESSSLLKLGCIALILAGVVGLKVLSAQA